MRLSGDDAAAALESLVPVDVVGLAPGRQRYAFHQCRRRHPRRPDDHAARDRFLDVIVNAGCRMPISATCRPTSRIAAACSRCRSVALLALQGPGRRAVDRLNPELRSLVFMTGAFCRIAGIDCFATRSGYTGEDGYEISVPAEQAVALARRAGAARSEAGGLGSRDTLRLEAGPACTATTSTTKTTPVEAGLTWRSRRCAARWRRAPRRLPRRSGDRQAARGRPACKRVGLVGLERVPVREGAIVVDAQGHKLGRVTSGTLAPSVGKPIAMAYLAANHALPNHEVTPRCAASASRCASAPMPFAPHRYHRG